MSKGIVLRFRNIESKHWLQIAARLEHVDPKYWTIPVVLRRPTLSPAKSESTWILKKSWHPLLMIDQSKRWGPLSRSEQGVSKAHSAPTLASPCPEPSSSRPQQCQPSLGLKSSPSSLQIYTLKHLEGSSLATAACASVGFTDGVETPFIPRPCTINSVWRRSGSISSIGFTKGDNPVVRTVALWLHLSPKPNLWLSRIWYLLPNISFTLSTAYIVKRRRESNGRSPSTATPQPSLSPRRNPPISISQPMNIKPIHQGLLSSNAVPWTTSSQPVPTSSHPQTSQSSHWSAHDSPQSELPQT